MRNGKIDQENLITGEEEEGELELEELVDYDGSIVGSKIPLGLGKCKNYVSHQNYWTQQYL